MFGFHPPLCATHVRLMCVYFHPYLLLTAMATVRPPKRRRTGHRPGPMVEDSDLALDTAMYIQSEGGERILVPVRPDAPEANVVPEPAPAPEPAVRHEYDQPADIDMDLDNHVTPPKKNRWFYMKEFVERVGGILQALQAREALPDSTTCAECRRSVAHWRCEDCIGGKLLCRICMRHSHFSNPFHRIECWTGTHFRKAALWEVGVYLMLPHQAGGICPNLLWQKQMLEIFQQQKDQVTPHSTEEPSRIDVVEGADPAPDPDVEAVQDANEIRLLDELFAGHNPDDIMEDDIGDLVDTEADVQDVDAGTAGFTNYMNQRLGPEPDVPDLPSRDTIPDAPNCDALNNQYVRVVHTNGLHHIALVSCTCQGQENITTDLIFAGWVPTSFVRVRTIFTVAVLDHFRCCNLEMRSSAYQFFQLLRRVTNPLAPSKVVNLYHELRRLSRLWRWVKKLRWAGYGQRVGQPINPKPGELGNFCPACPQIGINVAADWLSDPKRWVYRRVVTADGNFKADHVRQKSAAEDVWLSDGLGMTTTNLEYNAFLESAWNRATVSLKQSASFGVGSFSSQKAPCEINFKAIENAMLFSKACDVTGIVACACARHGCFAPNSIVNLFRGEQQKNVDWSLLETIRSTNVHPKQGLTLHYDVVCQYWVYLNDRIGHLLPSELEIDRAIGLFHVHAHKEECFYRFASSFIPGAGIVAGEILESLWSRLNLIATATRTATLAHRAEVIDDHASDSNHKKSLGMGKSDLFGCLTYIY
jgi:hypothetical protein